MILPKVARSTAKSSVYLFVIDWSKTTTKSAAGALCKNEHGEFQAEAYSKFSATSARQAEFVSAELGLKLTRKTNAEEIQIFGGSKRVVHPLRMKNQVMHGIAVKIHFGNQQSDHHGIRLHWDRTTRPSSIPEFCFRRLIEAIVDPRVRRYRSRVPYGVESLESKHFHLQQAGSSQPVRSGGGTIVSRG
ncbi:hypothetical protein IFM89_003300 [Coptis chinensis]|uniref:RNase H type-1 domain-containing protein n=1 Tax=Coptis chinensis TaxID=261450 RepID=A0A835ILY3_9MAGN|nr:hypothetical protein IFM89_003300 [Coptis chinensis]